MKDMSARPSQLSVNTDLLLAVSLSRMYSSLSPGSSSGSSQAMQLIEDCLRETESCVRHVRTPFVFCASRRPTHPCQR